jgi:hypothetical protein
MYSVLALPALLQMQADSIEHAATNMAACAAQHEALLAFSSLYFAAAAAFFGLMSNLPASEIGRCQQQT